MALKFFIVPLNDDGTGKAESGSAGWQLDEEQPDRRCAEAHGSPSLPLGG